MATIEKRIYDATLAREVLDNDVFQRAFADIREEYTQAWMNSPARDQEAREKLYLMLKLLEKVKSTLEATMTDGKIANLELEHEEKSMAQRVVDAVFDRQ